MGRNDWATPQKYFDLVQCFFDIKFDIDVCATAQSAKTFAYFDKACNGLEQDWTQYKYAWMNPPYSADLKPGQKRADPVIQDWLRKAYEEVKKSNYQLTVVALVPNDPSTKWWCDWALKASEIYFNCNGRLRFDDMPGSPTFTTALLVYNSAQTLRHVCFFDWKRGIIR